MKTTLHFKNPTLLSFFLLFLLNSLNAHNSSLFLDDAKPPFPVEKVDFIFAPGNRGNALFKNKSTSFENEENFNAIADEPSYCYPTYSIKGNSWDIEQFKIPETSFSYSFPFNGYLINDHLSTTVALEAGNSYNFQIITDGWLGIAVAADFNNNGNFEDSDELLVNPIYIAGDPQTYNLPVTIPASIAGGKYRLRLWTVLGNSGVGSPEGSACGSYTYGTYADFTMEVAPVISLPVLANPIVSEILGTTAIFSGEVTENGGATVTERGFVYSTSSTPTISDTKVQSGSGLGTYSETITTLTPGTTYYVRSYAINDAGIAYGREKTFTTYKEPVFNSTPATEVEYNNAYTYGIVASQEGDLETSITALTLPQWLSFSFDGESGATLFGDIPSEVRLSGVAGDENGNIYAIRQNGTEIFKITPDGTTTSWKSGLISGSVYALHISNGYIYIPRYSDATNSITRIPLSNPAATEENFYAVSGGILSLTDKNGFIYAANYTGRQIIKINENSKTSEVILNSADGLPIYGPFGMALDDEDNLYIATYGNMSILKYDGTSLTTIVSDLPSFVTSIKIDAKGNFYLSLSGGGVRKYDPSWSDFQVISETANDDIWSLSFTESGTLVYAKFNSNQVYRIQTGAALFGTPAKPDLGNHEVVLKASNAAGSTSQSFTINVVDKTGPVVHSFSPAHQTSDVPLQPTLSLTFDEEISLGNNGIITLENLDGVVQTYNLAVQEDREKFHLSEDKLTLSLKIEKNLPVNTQLSVGISTGLVADKYNNAFKGIAADAKSWTFTTINKLDQSISFSEIASKSYGDPTFVLGDEQTDRGLSVTYTAQDPAVVSISGNQATILKAGTTLITANQEGDATHFAATPVTQTLTVDKAAITIAADIKSKIYGEADPELTYQLTVGALVGTDNFTGDLAREDGENAGTYAIEQGSLILNSNYDITYITADFTIKKAEAVITADAVQTFTYDGSVKNVAAGLNHSEAELTFTPQQGYTNAGTYPVTVSSAETENYLATSKDVSVEIEKAEIAGVVFEGDTFVYDGTAHSIFVSNLPEGATVSYSNNGRTNAGTYKVVSTVSQENFNDKELAAALTIKKAEAVITADAVQTLTYDGTVKNVTASLNHSEAELTYSPQKGYTNAGTYPVTVSSAETANYLSASKDVSLEIKNAEITGVVFEGDTFVYDGTAHSIFVSNLPEGATVSYSNNGQTNAGTYKVVATVSQENFNDKELAAALVIEKAEALITADAVQTFTYDGTVKNVTASLNHSEAELNYSPQQGYTNAGTYPVTVSSVETENYLATSKDVSLEIENAEITGVTFDGDTFTYDGTAHSIYVSGLPEGATVSYSNNGQTNSGTYKVVATVGQENFNDKELAAALVIEKAEAIITADAVQTFTYDGTIKNVTASLNHSEAELTYSPQQGYTNAATYPVTVSSAETDNYLSASKDVSLVIEDAEITGVTFEGNTFVYDGTAHSIFVSNLPEGATVKYENNGQINAGIYDVTATVSRENHSNLVLSAKLVLNKAAQSITFDELEDVNLRDGNFSLDAKASSGLPVSFSYTYDSEKPAATVSGPGNVKLMEAGQINIIATQVGDRNFEAATPVTRTLVIRGSQAKLNTVVVNGNNYSNPSEEIYYLVDCGNAVNEVKVQLDPVHGASLDQEKMFTIATPAPGIYSRTITVTSEDGFDSRSYNIKIEKTFNFEDVVIQKFNNVLLVNNNPETNGGYKFKKFDWYKNGRYVGSGQYFSEGQNANDQLDPNSTFYVILTTVEGEVLKTCATSIQLKSSYKVVLTPNPVDAGGKMELVVDYPEEELEGMEIFIHTMNGNLLEQIRSNKKVTTIQLPANMPSGVYVLSFKTGKNTNFLKFIVK